MLDIQFSSPYKVNYGSTLKWRREYCIPKELLNGFFLYWKKNRFKLLSDGFSVSKSEKFDKWYLYETQDDVALFRDFGNNPSSKTIIPYVPVILPSYDIKNKDGLREWQVPAVGKLISAIQHWGSCVDGSDLGVGKTFSAGGVVRELEVPFAVVCPKPVIHQWKKVINNHFHLQDSFKGIINYELLIRGRKDSNIASYVLKRESRRNVFTWKLPKDTIIIWDEAHRVKNFKTKASKSCIRAYEQGYKQMFLSATLATSPLELRTIGICMGMFKQHPAKEYYDWTRNHGVYDGHWGLEFNNSPKVLKQLHQYLFEERGVRLLRDTIPNFPETEIIVNAYDMEEKETSEIRKIYNEMKEELEKIKKKEKTDDSEMAIRIRALQKTEMLKIPLIEEMIREGLDSGMSVVVFLNYSDSIDALAQRLNTKCIYDGRNEKIRQKYIELFQENKERVLITNIAAAKEGLNLQDLDGKYPRLTIISPGYSIIKIKQCLGRVHRESSKSKSIQKFIYIAGTQEEDVVNSIGQKLENLTLINNGMITDNDLKIG